MVNQVTVILKTTKGDWETTFQKSTRIKDVILGIKVHFRFAKESKFTIHNKSTPDIDFEPDRALINYNVKDGDVLIFKQVSINN